MKYKLGDLLYKIKYDYTKTPCSECNSSGEVEVIYKEETTKVLCPKCKGDKILINKIYSVQSVKIYAIQEDDEGIKVAIEDNWECSHWDYMEPKHIGYDTKKEAELEVKKLNAEQNK